MTERNTVLIRYDEIGLKGKNRKYFEKCLLKNIKRVLSEGEGIVYRSPRGRILLDIPSSFVSECRMRLKSVPGIASFSIGISMNPPLISYVIFVFMETLDFLEIDITRFTRNKFVTKIT